MKRWSFFVALMLVSIFAVRADETITVSAKSADISEGLDLKAVAKLFARAENLEAFESLLNNPDSAFTNLDLNGDGAIDYIRVVETASDSQHLIVLQAVLAKDIYQDVASILVVKDEANNVKVQIVGDEYIYGANYVIEPVYIYRPVIYDWFWGPTWVCWCSPYYWDFYPPYWHVHACWDRRWYWDRCYAYHRCYPYCSFRYASAPAAPYRTLQSRSGVSRRDYAQMHPQKSFSARQTTMSNARDLQRSYQAETRRTSVAATPATTRQPSTTTSTSRQPSSATTTRQVATTTSTTRQPSTTTSTSRQPSSATTSRQATATTRTYHPSTTTTSTRTYQSSYQPSSSYSGGSTRSYSGGSSTRSFSGGGSASFSGGSARGFSGSASTRR